MKFIILNPKKYGVKTSATPPTQFEKHRLHGSKLTLVKGSFGYVVYQELKAIWHTIIFQEFFIENNVTVEISQIGNKPGVALFYNLQGEIQLDVKGIGGFNLLDSMTYLLPDPGIDRPIGYLNKGYYSSFYIELGQELTRGLYADFGIEGPFLPLMYSTSQRDIVIPSVNIDQPSKNIITEIQNRGLRGVKDYTMQKMILELIQIYFNSYQLATQ